MKLTFDIPAKHRKGYYHDRYAKQPVRRHKKEERIPSPNLYTRESERGVNRPIEEEKKIPRIKGHPFESANPRNEREYEWRKRGNMENLRIMYSEKEKYQNNDEDAYYGYPWCYNYYYPGWGYGQGGRDLGYNQLWYYNQQFHPAYQVNRI